MEGGMTSSLDVDNPRFQVSLGPFKKHVVHAAKVLALIDIGFSALIFIVFLMHPTFSKFISISLSVITPSFVYLALKKENKHYALLPLILSFIGLLFWSVACLYTAFFGGTLLIIWEMALTKMDELDATLIVPQVIIVVLICTIHEIYYIYKVKVFYYLHNFLIDKEISARAAANLHHAAPTAYQGSYQGYEGQQQMFEEKDVF
ncbi:hypothetical protein PFISCL1PPCAC_4288 [Pristionchus fissidentatus]|uniref:Uncharacterized protein n=1 Tax=Pristionchus fissidentatus TaxID=1538716 RepID=A0AAV5V0B9_9BILA|nr:hypothetical protein PFISCL1PPCAC_4288 [Pristionchus fissidentatus]